MPFGKSLAALSTAIWTVTAGQLAASHAGTRDVRVLTHVPLHHATRKPFIWFALRGIEKMNQGITRRQPGTNRRKTLSTALVTLLVCAVSRSRFAGQSPLPRPPR
jgi:hypothetical protein